MAIHATVVSFKNEFVATLSDERRIERADFLAMAQALVHAGVRSDGVEYAWQAGQRMITAGQRVALQAEMRRLERGYAALSIAA